MNSPKLTAKLVATLIKTGVITKQDKQLATEYIGSQSDIKFTSFDGFKLWKANK